MMKARPSGLFVLATLLTAASLAAPPETSTRELGTDRFVAGGSVRVEQPVSGDLLAAGGNLDVESQVGGDVVLVGGQLRVAAPVGGSIYGGGGRLVVDGTVGRNVRVGGGEVELTPKSVVAGNVTIGGGKVSLRGEIKGAVTVGGGRVTIDGPIGGDVESAAGKLSLGPNARISGTLRYRSGNELERDPAAQVGAVEQIASPQRGRDDAERDARDWDEPHRRWSGPSWLWTAGMIILAVALTAAMPQTTQRATTTWRERFGPSLLWGFIVLVCVPAAAVILAITLIGFPLALVGLLLYGATLLVGYALSGMAIGQWALQRWRATASDSRGWRLAFAALGVLALALVGSIPFVGALVALLAVIAGIGALAQLLRAPVARAS